MYALYLIRISLALKQMVTSTTGIVVYRKVMQTGV